MYTIFSEVSPGNGHINFVYYGTANSFDTKPQQGESKALKWYTKADLKKAHNIQKNILVLSKEALDLYYSILMIKLSIC